MLRRASIVLSLIIVSTGAFSQQDKLREALEAYQNKDYKTAKTHIDAVSAHAETSGDPLTWYYKGFIYKDYYKAFEAQDKQSKARLEALESFKKFLVMNNKEDDSQAGAKKGIKFLASSIYNDAATSVDPQGYELAIANYDLYKKYIKIVDPNKNFQELDINFYLVLAAMYSQTYDSNRKDNKEFFNKAVGAYESVLAAEANNLSGNYNLGILFYNEAVNIIKEMDYDTDIITLELIQDECVHLFEKALPYMQRAYELNPKRKETLIGLSGIYFSLNEMDKSEEIKKQLEELEGN